MNLSTEEERKVKELRWSEEVKKAKILHESHSLTQSGNCCQILMIEDK